MSPAARWGVAAAATVGFVTALLAERPRRRRAAHHGRGARRARGCRFAPAAPAAPPAGPARLASVRVPAIHVRAPRAARPSRRPRPSRRRRAAPAVVTVAAPASTPDARSHGHRVVGRAGRCRRPRPRPPRLAGGRRAQARGATARPGPCLRRPRDERRRPRSPHPTRRRGGLAAASSWRPPCCSPSSPPRLLGWVTGAQLRRGDGPPLPRIASVGPFTPRSSTATGGRPRRAARSAATIRGDLRVYAPVAELPGRVWIAARAGDDAVADPGASPAPARRPISGLRAARSSPDDPPGATTRSRCMAAGCSS